MIEKHSVFSKLKFTINGIQTKITRHAIRNNIYIQVVINSRLEIVENINELECRNRKYPIGNKKDLKNVSRALMCCGTASSIPIYI